MADDDLVNDVVSSEEDDDDTEDHHHPLNDVVVSPSPSPSPPPPPASTAAAAATTTTTPATPTPPTFPPFTTVTVALATPERKPIDDSRRLFQRLWTDEDEIELLQGYLDYTAARGGGSGGHHHDTTAFYELIKNKFQLEFNKNQLVEKLRRLKKKYRNIISKMSSGKDFVFKSPHDHATFEISRKIWSNLSANLEFDDSDHNPNPNPNSNLFKLSSSRKRFRDDNHNHNPNHNPHHNNMNVNNDINVVTNDDVKNVGVSPPLQGLIEETIKKCLSPVLRDVINSTVVNAAPQVVGGMDEKWRKQQIIELEAYSKRLDLVQDQIKSTLDELRSISSSKSE